MAIKPITETLQHVRGGMLIIEASEQLAEVVRAVETTGKAGEITIKLQVKKLSRSGALEIIDKLTSKVPQEAPLTTMLYPTPEGNLNETVAGWKDFTAWLMPQASHEWKTWTQFDGKRMSQFEFAQFIEDNIKDVANEDGYPTGTDMLKMAVQFEMSQDKRIKSAIRIQSGGTNIEYVDNDDAATVERMEAFNKFMLGIPVFWQGQAYYLEAKLRYRVREGVLSLWYDLVRPDIVVDDAVKQILSDIEANIEVPVLYGEIFE